MEVSNKEFIYRILSSLALIVGLSFIILKIPIFLNFLIIIVLLFSAYEWHKMAKKIPLKLCGFLFLIISFFSVYQIIDLGESFLSFIFVLLICVSTDIGGYVFGKVFKGPKLTKISPNKTYSGMVGGYLISILSVIIFLTFADQTFNNQNDLKLTYIILVTFLISSISQIGDLVISFFKRLSGVKNTGNVIPGHGGILDRIDGMIFAFPFSYVFFLISGFKIQ